MSLSLHIKEHAVLNVKSGTGTGELTTVTAPLVLTGYDVSIPVATSSANGYLSSTDWTTFNGKQSALVDSAGLLAALDDETGTGLAVFNNSPTLITPVLGTPTSGTLTNCTGLPAASVVAGTLGTGAYVFDNTVSGITDLTITGTFTDGTASLVGGSLTSVKLGTLTDNGFVKTGSGDGTLSVDTEVYAPDDQTFYIGTTQVAINRASAGLTLAGITLTTPEIGVATGTSLDLGGTTLLASRQITVDTGGVFNISIGSASGDDFTVDTDKFVVEGDTGNVGIGTTGPSTKLQVYTGNTTNANEGISLVRGAGLDIFGFKHKSNAGGLYRGAITYNSIESMTFSSSGNVGIGTVAPDRKVEINTGAATGGIRLTYNDADGSATTYSDILVDSSGNLEITATGGTVSFGNENVVTTGYVDTPQIKFPATQSASADANTLDDYEEGTYTVTITCGTSGTITVAPTYNLASYTKIGRVVTVQGFVIVSARSSPVGEAQFNLPFTSINSAEGSSLSVGSIALGTSAFVGTYVVPRVGVNEAYFTLEGITSGSGTATESANIFNVDHQITFQLTYIV